MSQAIRLVWHTLCDAEERNLCQKNPSIKIIDLAKTIAPEAQIELMVVLAKSFTNG